MKTIPFNHPWHAPQELDYVTQAIANTDTASGFTAKCTEWLLEKTKAKAIYLTHSCTAALEMAAILADIRPGDEVIMPSFTFPSTANAFVLRGGVPVFVDIRRDTLNIDERLIEAAITARTKAIVPMHYAGVACNMEAIMNIANRHGLLVIEDAAQGIGASYDGKPLGTLGHMGAYSFHKTKNVQCTTGGALIINNQDFLPRAEIIAEKGTNTRAFLRRETRNYSWHDLGSAYLMSELHAAVLFSQLEKIDYIQKKRQQLWSDYLDRLAPLEKSGLRLSRLEQYPHNAHSFYIMLTSPEQRCAVQNRMLQKGISLSTHYEPLHESVAGKKWGRSSGPLANTTATAQRLLRLPLYPSLTSQDVATICRHLADVLSEHSEEDAIPAAVAANWH